MERVKLVVHPRTETGSRAVRRLRKQGMIPGVLYGHGKAAHMHQRRRPRPARRAPPGGGMNAVLDIIFEGQKTAHTAVIKDYQLDGVTHVVTHVDFHEVKLDEPIEATVAVVFEGQAGRRQDWAASSTILMREITVKGAADGDPRACRARRERARDGRRGAGRRPRPARRRRGPRRPRRGALHVLVPRKAALAEEEAAEAEEAAAEEAGARPSPRSSAERATRTRPRLSAAAAAVAAA